MIVKSLLSVLGSIQLNFVIYVNLFTIVLQLFTESNQTFEKYLLRVLSIETITHMITTTTTTTAIDAERRFSILAD